MKKAVLLATTLWATSLCHASDFAGLAGIVQTNDTVEFNNFINPRDIWTVYTPNAPERQAVILAYVALKKIGEHRLSIEWVDSKGKYLDKCEFSPSKVDSLPYVHTITCNYGGRLPSGGLTFSVYDAFGGKKEKVGELFIPSKF